MKSFTFHINRKYTVWEQETHSITAETEDMARELMTELFQTDNFGDTLIEVETLYDTMEEMTPNENGGMPTVELATTDGVILSDNG